MRSIHFWAAFAVRKTPPDIATSSWAPSMSAFPSMRVLASADFRLLRLSYILRHSEFLSATRLCHFTSSSLDYLPYFP